MHIRVAQRDDAVAACDVIRRSIIELCEADHGNDEARLGHWLANKTPENMVAWIANSHVVVAEEGSQIVGVAALTGSGHVTLNYVAPEARFRGVSKALLREVESKAMELGCRACTVKSTRTADRFYRAVGYCEQSGLPKGMLSKPLPVAQGSDGPRRLCPS
jgi:GNAT superfamily N-acetyltransferase